MRRAGLVTRMGNRRGAYSVLVCRPEVKRPLGRPSSRWKNSINMDLKYVGWGGMEWIDLAQDTDKWRARVNAVNKLRVS